VAQLVKKSSGSSLPYSQEPVTNKSLVSYSDRETGSFILEKEQISESRLFRKILIPRGVKCRDS
jgi:hypothetical protein